MAVKVAVLAADPVAQVGVVVEAEQAAAEAAADEAVVVARQAWVTSCALPNPSKPLWQMVNSK